MKNFFIRICGVIFIFSIFGILFFVTNTTLNKQTDNSIIIQANITNSSQTKTFSMNGKSYVVYVHNIEYSNNGKVYFCEYSLEYLTNDIIPEDYLYIYIDATSGEMINIYDNTDFLNVFNIIFIIFGSVAIIVFVFALINYIKDKSETEIENKYGEKEMIDNPNYYKANGFDFFRYFLFFCLYCLVVTLTFINPLIDKLSSSYEDINAVVIEVDEYLTNAYTSNYYVKYEYEYNNETCYYDAIIKTEDKINLYDNVTLIMNNNVVTQTKTTRSIVYFIFSGLTLLGLLIIWFYLFKYCCFSKEQIYGYPPHKRAQILNDLMEKNSTQ